MSYRYKHNTDIYQENTPAFLHPQDRVLLVDDEISVVLGIKRALRSEFEIETALSADQALTMLRGGDFAVVVSDMHMPGTDGAEFLSKVRSLAPFAKRIMLTGHSNLSTAAKAVNDAQVFRFLEKPCSIEQIRAALCQAIEASDRKKKCRDLTVNILRSSDGELCWSLKRLVEEIEASTIDGNQSWELTAYASYIAEQGNGLKERADALSALIGQPERGRELDRKHVSVDRLLTDIRQSAAGHLAKAGVRLHVEAGPSLNRIYADETLCRFALTALVSNAAQVSRPGDVIDLIVADHASESRSVVFEVCDQGPGLDVEDLAPTKPPLAAGEARLPMGHRGLGLGLPICVTIARAHGGRLTVLANPGGGSRAVFEIAEATETFGRGHASFGVRG